MGRSRIAFLLVILLFGAGLALTSLVLQMYYLPASLVLLAAAMAPFFARFELRRVEAREIVLLAVLAAMAAMGRVAFAPLPSVQPTSFVIIVTALVFGGESGFLVGAVAALVSNLFLGQGPWTPWQMFAWGLMGASAGWLRHPLLLLRSRILLCLFGAVWGFLFGWIMNIWTLLTIPDALNWATVLLKYSASVPFDLAHAAANTVLLALFARPWVRILTRFKVKYGLLDGGRD
ncbi:ECF transporter S component [Paenibacillus glufosinatiresistens]|uniref:ECF transporter S component n=1 Tax=Paenibacillus glufosinatiresistens TaxID=3070657 RepID=UPI00286DE898|nr:ECF transporter S component [Paenibacillus sp. YX.27]